MKKAILIFNLFLVSVTWGQSFDGYVLYNKQNQNTTYLIDKDGNAAKTWSCNTSANYAVLLKEDGNIVRGGVYGSNQLNGAAIGGVVQEYDTNGDVVWEFIYSNSDHVSHHDIALNPTNNSVFLIAWEVISQADLIQAGYDGATSEKWAPHFVEVEPDGSGGGQIIWEWHIMDHMIQDFDASKDNYGVIADHPELIDINQIAASGGGPGPPGGANGDWFHCNGIDYNPTLDQIVFTSRHSSEFYIIDHSTTTAQAATHAGGNTTKGGDILFRWGNPSNYDAPGAQIVPAAVHDPRWIKAGRPNAGYIQFFNNEGNNGSSTVDMINPPLIGYNYDWISGTSYAPTTYASRHNCLDNASGQSASDRMSNGNIFVAVSHEYMYEVDANDNVVWQYNADPAKAFRYECAYDGIQNLLGNICGLGVDENKTTELSVYPNPSNGEITLDGITLNDYTVNVIDMQGNIVYSVNNKTKLDLSILANGLYFLKVFNENGVFAINQISLNK